MKNLKLKYKDTYLEDIPEGHHPIRSIQKNQR